MEEVKDGLTKEEFVKERLFLGVNYRMKDDPNPMPGLAYAKIDKGDLCYTFDNVTYAKPWSEGFTLFDSSSPLSYVRER